MRGDFRTALFGYNRRQVKEYITRLNGEHENALGLRNDRFIELRDQNNIMKAELARYKSMEQEISDVLITARTTANELIREGEKSAQEEKANLVEEIKQLDRLTHALYTRLETSIQQAADMANGFERELEELLMRKEAFLKSSYGFEKGQ